MNYRDMLNLRDAGLRLSQAVQAQAQVTVSLQDVQQPELDAAVSAMVEALLPITSIPDDFKGELASASGAGLVGTPTGTVQQVLDNLAASIDRAVMNIGDYSEGPLTVRRRDQLILQAGLLYAILPSVSLPYTTSSWGVDSDKFYPLSDAVLRAQLLSGSGGTRVGATDMLGTPTTVQGALDALRDAVLGTVPERLEVSPAKYGAVGNGIADDTAAVVAAEIDAYENGLQLVLNAQYMVTSDIEFRRQFRCTTGAKLLAPAAGDTVPTRTVYLSRKMECSGMIFEYLNVHVSPKVGEFQHFMAALLSRCVFLNAPVRLGQDTVPTSGYGLQYNEHVWTLSRAANAVTAVNTSNVEMHASKFQSYRNALAVQPTLSYASHNVRAVGLELTNCIGGILLQGTSMARISNAVLENVTISGSVRDTSSILMAGLLGTYVSDLSVTGCTIHHTSDCVKLQGCTDSTILHNDLASIVGAVFRISGCPDGHLAYNKTRTAGYMGIFGPASLNPVITANPYGTTGWRIHDNDWVADNFGVKIYQCDDMDVFRNKLTCRAAPSQAVLWFELGNTRCTHSQNVLRGPSGTGFLNQSGSGVAAPVDSTALVVTPAPAATVTAPVITENDVDLGGGKSYVVTFTVNHYSAIKQKADDTAPKTLSTWMSSTPGATLAWNSSAWNPATQHIGDIVVNGLTYDNYNTEDWWWARSALVIDRWNRLTCRMWAGADVVPSVPPGVAGRQIVEGAWQTCAFRPPLVVDGVYFDPRPSGLAPDPGYTTQISARTALGQKADGTYVLVCCDGQTGVSGATLLQLSAKMLALGCVNAFCLDGGGSTTLWYQGAIINSPSDVGGERAIPVCMYV